LENVAIPHSFGGYVPRLTAYISHTSSFRNPSRRYRCYGLPSIDVQLPSIGFQNGAGCIIEIFSNFTRELKETMEG
jgi:hypothetical protein